MSLGCPSPFSQRNKQKEKLKTKPKQKDITLFMLFCIFKVKVFATLKTTSLTSFDI